MNIFLAEDNKDNYLVIRSNLKKVNFPVNLIWACDGEIAIEMLKGLQVVDLFLVDIEMPKLDGIALMEWIRAQKRFELTYSIAITASVFAEMKTLYLEKGFHAILEKPFSRKEFLHSIASMKEQHEH